MASSSQPPTPQRPRATPPSSGVDDGYPTEMDQNVLLDIAGKSFKAGAAFGVLGMMFGAGAGIVRSAPPVIFGAAAGLQWFALASTYTASKNVYLYPLRAEDATRSDRVKASGIAGGLAGMVGGMIRGPRNIIPGILVFGTLGASYEYLSPRFKDRPKHEELKPKTSWLDSKWSPVKRLSDKDYEKILEEKLLRVEAEISIIDDHIASLRESVSLPTKSDEENETGDKP